MWLCLKHHRGAGGIHHAAYADYEAQKYVHNLITKKDTNGKVQAEPNE